MGPADRWRRTVDPYFGFLVELGFDTVTVEASSFWDVRVRYVSSTAAVQVSKSIEFDRTEFSLIRLHDGEVPRARSGSPGRTPTGRCWTPSWSCEDPI